MMTTESMLSKRPVLTIMRLYFFFLSYFRVIFIVFRGYAMRFALVFDLIILHVAKSVFCNS